MPKYRLSYGSTDEFYAQSAGEVVPFLQERHFLGSGEDERVFLRRLAIELCEWSGCNFYFHDRDSLALSMIESGLLSEVSELT